jgi:hypothetical protein
MLNVPTILHSPEKVLLQVSMKVMDASEYATPVNDTTVAAATIAPTPVILSTEE